MVAVEVVVACCVLSRLKEILAQPVPVWPHSGPPLMSDTPATLPTSTPAMRTVSPGCKPAASAKIAE